MSSRIEKLLEQRKNAGEAIGKAIVINLVHDLRHPGGDPLLAQSDLDMALDRLITDSDQQAYNAYVELYNTIFTLYDQNEALNQQAQHGYYRLLCALTGAAAGDDLLRRQNLLPRLATAAGEKALRAQLTREHESAPQPRATMLMRWLTLRMDGPEGASLDLQAALASLDDTPFTDAALIGIIPGLWQDDGQPLIPQTSARRLLAYCDRLYRGEPAPETMLLADAPKEAPALTARDVLSDGPYSLLPYYSGQMTGDGGAALEAFAKTFPALYAALVADLAAQPGAKRVPAEPEGMIPAPALRALGLDESCAWEMTAPRPAVAVLEEGREPPMLPGGMPGLAELIADKAQTENLRVAHRMLTGALYRVCANNTLLALLADAYAVPEAAQLALPPTPARAQLESLDAQAALLCRPMRPGGPRTAQDATRAQWARTLFPKVATLSFEPEHAAAEALLAMLKASGKDSPPPPIPVLQAMLLSKEDDKGV